MNKPLSWTDPEAIAAREAADSALLDDLKAAWAQKKAGKAKLPAPHRQRKQGRPIVKNKELEQAAHEAGLEISPIALCKKWTPLDEALYRAKRPIHYRCLRAAVWVAERLLKYAGACYTSTARGGDVERSIREMR